MILPTCPLPEVESALAPYIRTRHEAFLIRQRLTAYLQSHVSHSSDAPVTHLSLACPPPTLEARDVPPETTGLRRQYLEALEAHTAARRRRDALQQQLQDLQDESTGGTSDEARRDDMKEAMGVYTGLVRQRRRLARLQVLQAGIEELLENAPGLVDKDLKTLVEEEGGRAPDPPGLTLEAESRDPRVEELVLRLKKELLAAKKRLERTMREKGRVEEEVKAMGTPGLEVEVAALRSARDELVAWMEGELGKIGEESEMFDQASPAKKRAPGEEALSLQEHHEKIQELYDAYLEQRKHYVSTIDTASSELRKGRTKPSNQPRQSILPLNQSDAPTTRVAYLLPYIPSLLSISRTENDLQQQITHLRRQIASAADETLRTLHRHADESHMVPPRSDNVQVWIDAAKEYTKETEAVVESNLAEGEESIEQAKKIQKDLSERKENFRRIKA